MSLAPSTTPPAPSTPAPGHHAAGPELLPELPPNATLKQRVRAYAASPMTKGTVLAIGAGIASGVNMPLVAKYATNVDVFPAACLLEAGATSLQWTLGWLLPQQGGALFPLSGRTAVLLGAAAAVGSVSAPITLVLGLKHTSAASVALSTNLEPFLAAGGAWLLFKDRPSKYMFAASVMALASGALCTVGQLKQAPASGPGLGIAAASAASWAGFDMTLYGLRQVRSQYVVGVSTAIGALVCAALTGATGQHFPSGTDAGVLYGLGVGAFGVVDTLLSMSMRSIGAGRASLLFGAVALSVGVGLSCAMGYGEMTPLIGASMGVALLGSLVLASEQFGSKALYPQPSGSIRTVTPVPPEPPEPAERINLDDMV